MNTTKKFIHEFKAGDLVRAHGGLFRIIEDARESQGHRPQAAHLVEAAGPSSCAAATGICIEGEVPGYFKPGTEWRFQGNFHAGRYAIA